LTTDLTNAFLAHLRRGGSYAYWWVLDEVKTYEITRGKRAGQQEKCKRTYWFPVARASAIPHGKTEHVYFGVHPALMLPKERKGKEGPYVPKPEFTRPLISEIAAINCLFGEFDAKDFADGKAGALAHIEALEARPSVLIDSGGGYHAYWLLYEPVLLTDENRAAVRALQNRWVQFVESDEDAKDLARVLRVPGRPNVKAKYGPDYPMVSFVWCELDQLYDISELAALIPAAITAQEERPAPEFVPTPGDHSAYVNAAYQGEVAAVRSATDGLKHRTLRNAAIKLGTLLWTGTITEGEIEEGLSAAADYNGADVGYADKTIRDGIAYGKARPRNIPERPKEAERTVSGTDTPAQATEDAPRPTTCEYCSDLGNARRLVALCGDDLRFVKEWGWLIWDGRRWELDQTGEIERRAKAMVVSIYQEAANAPEHLRATLAKHAITSQAAFKIKAAITLTESEKSIRLVANDFDSHDWLLTCDNGTLDLRTGQLGPSSRTDLLTRAINVSYNPTAKCPIFLSFLDQIFVGNTAMIAYIQRVMGYALTGSTGAQCMFVLYGSGANGKSVLLNVIRALLGEYARNAAPETFLLQQQEKIRSDLARLAGCRAVLTVELDEGKRLSEALVKQMTGGEPITARFLNKNEFEFTPRFKVLMATNHKPVIRGTDYAIWRRIRLIPFTFTIPEAERDPLFIDRLTPELPGILAWAVQGCLAWQQGGLREPDEVQAATSAYRSEMDLIGQFLDETCTLHPTARVGCGELYTAYSKWCDEGGERAMTQRAFGARMTERSIDRVRGSGGSWFYEGVGLLLDRKFNDFSTQISDVSDVSDVNSLEASQGNSYTKSTGTLGNLRHLRHSSQNTSHTEASDPAFQPIVRPPLPVGSHRNGVPTAGDTIQRLKDRLLPDGDQDNA
jgi:P4 family phage/plasmid primase-like protien